MAPARSASSARRACGIRVRSTPSKDCPGRSAGWSAAAAERAVHVFPSTPMEDNRTGPDINFTEASETAGPTAAADGDSQASELQRERDEFKDLLLRKTAEFDNYR